MLNIHREHVGACSLRILFEHASGPGFFFPFFAKISGLQGLPQCIIFAQFFEMLRTVASPETFVLAKYVKENSRKLTIMTKDSAILWQHFLEMLRTVASPGTFGCCDRRFFYKCTEVTDTKADTHYGLWITSYQAIKAAEAWGRAGFPQVGLMIRR